MPVMSRRGTNPDPEASGGSALLDAINRNKIHLAKFILDAVDREVEVVNFKDFKGKTPLIRSVYIKEERTRGKAIHLLLQKKADVNMTDDVGRTALSYACELRCNDVVQILVKNNVDPDLADHKGNTPLIYSAMVGNDKAIEILLKSFRRLGLDVDRKNNTGLTAMLVAAKLGYNSCASLLSLEGGASVYTTDPEKGMTAEDWARAQGCSTPEVQSFSTVAPHPRKRRRRRLDNSSIGSTYSTKSKTSLKDVDLSRRKSNNSLSRSLPTNSLRQAVHATGPTDVLMETLTDLRISSAVPAPLPPPLARIGTKQTDIIQRDRSPKINLHGCHYDGKSVPQLRIQKAPTHQGKILVHVSPTKLVTHRKQTQAPGRMMADHSHLKRHERKDTISVLASQLTNDLKHQQTLSDDEAYSGKARVLGPIKGPGSRAAPGVAHEDDSDSGSSSSFDNYTRALYEVHDDHDDVTPNFSTETERASRKDKGELGIPSDHQRANSSC